MEYFLTSEQNPVNFRENSFKELGRVKAINSCIK